MYSVSYLGVLDVNYYQFLFVFGPFEVEHINYNHERKEENKVTGNIINLSSNSL